MAKNEENEIMSVELPDWSIDDLYRRAWQIVKNNKVLWIFGAALAGTSASSFNGANFSDLGKSVQENPKESTEAMSMVLGATTSAFADFFTNLFSAIPPSFYILLAIEIIFLLFFAIAVSLAYRSWATGALLHAITTCISGKKATIQESSEQTFPILTQLIKLQTIPYVLFTFFAILFLGIPVVLLLLGVGGLLVGALFLLIIFIAIAVGLFFSLTTIWAERALVTKHISWQKAWREGFLIARKKLWASYLLAIVNTLLILLLVVVPVGIFVGMLIAALFTWGNNASLSLVLAGIASLLFFAFLFFIIIGSGIITAFKATVWSLAYQAIKEKYA